MTATTTKAAKPKQAKPHPTAYVGDKPCANCGSEWMRLGVTFTDDGEGEFGGLCANLWCPTIKQMRAIIDGLKAQRLMLAKLASDTPQFDNPLHIYEAKALRDKLLSGDEIQGLIYAAMEQGRYDRVFPPQEPS